MKRLIWTLALAGTAVTITGAIATAAATPLHERLVRFETTHEIGTLDYQICTVVDIPAPSNNDVAGTAWSPATWPAYGPQERCYSIDVSNLFGNVRRHA